MKIQVLITLSILMLYGCGGRNVGSRDVGSIDHWPSRDSKAMDVNLMTVMMIDFTQKVRELSNLQALFLEDPRKRKSHRNAILLCVREMQEMPLYRLLLCETSADYRVWVRTYNPKALYKESVEVVSLRFQTLVNESIAKAPNFRDGNLAVVSNAVAFLEKHKDVE